MLTLRATCAIKNGSKQLSFDVGGRSYLGRGGGGGRQRQAGSLATSAGRIGHFTQIHLGLNALLCVCVCVCMVIVLTPSRTPVYCLARQKHSADKDSVVDLKWTGESGEKEEAGKQQLFPFFIPCQSINHVLLCNARADVDCLGVSWLERAAGGGGGGGGSHLWVVAADGSGCVQAELLTSSAELGL